MPELPEVEVVKQSLQKYILNKKLLKIIVKNKNLRFPVHKTISKILSNIKILSVKRISKYVVIEFKGNLFLLIHLGMSGTLHLFKNNKNIRNTNLSFYHKRDLPKKHNHIFFKFKYFSIVFNDPRRFGFIKLIKGNKNLKIYFDKIGPDPFDKNFNLGYLKNHLKNKVKNIKNTLIDQKSVSGIGNIYVSEILNYAKVNPLRPCRKINDEDLSKIIFYTKKVLRRSINIGGTTIINFQSIKGGQGSYQKEFRAYDRKGQKCKNKLCFGTIIKINLSNRSTYMCNICQK